MEGFLCVSRIRSEVEVGHSVCLGLDQRYGEVSVSVKGAGSVFLEEDA